MEQWAALTERKLLRRQRAQKLRKGVRRRCLAEFWDVWWYYLDLTERQRDRDAVAAQSSNAVKLLQGAVSRLTAAKAQGEKDRIQVPDPRSPCIVSVRAYLLSLPPTSLPSFLFLSPARKHLCHRAPNARVRFTAWLSGEWGAR